MTYGKPALNKCETPGCKTVHVVPSLARDCENRWLDDSGRADYDEVIPSGEAQLEEPCQKKKSVFI